MLRTRDYIRLVCQDQGGFEVLKNVVEKDPIFMSKILQASLSLNGQLSNRFGHP